MPYIKVILFITVTVVFYFQSFKFLSKVKWWAGIKGAITGLILIFPYILFILIPSDFRPGSDWGSNKDWAFIYAAVFACGGFVFGFIASLSGSKKEPEV